MKANTYIREIEPVFKKKTSTKKVKIKKSKDAYDLFSDMKNLTQEKVIALHLTADNTVLCFQVVHIGTINEAFFNPADILRTALLTGAVALIVIHNHPSGNLKPSPLDKKAIEDLKEASRLFKVRVFDSIIIGDGKYYSAADEGQL